MLGRVGQGTVWGRAVWAGCGFEKGAAFRRIWKGHGLGGCGKTQFARTKRPRGLKPAHISDDLRGPEGPLFHGRTDIGEFSPQPLSAVPIITERCRASAPEVRYFPVRKCRQLEEGRAPDLSGTEVPHNDAGRRGLFRLGRSSPIFHVTGRCVTNLVRRKNMDQTMKPFSSEGTDTRRWIGSDHHGGGPG